MCNDGAFGITGATENCKPSSLGGIQKYMDTRSLSYTSVKIKEKYKLKELLDKGYPVILSLRQPLGHILTIVGYTDTPGQFIVVDTYTHIDKDPYNRRWSFDGYRAVYNLYDTNYNVKSPYQINYLLPIGK